MYIWIYCEERTAFHLLKFLSIFFLIHVLRLIFIQEGCHLISDMVNMTHGVFTFISGFYIVYLLCTSVYPHQLLKSRVVNAIIYLFNNYLIHFQRVYNLI